MIITSEEIAKLANVSRSTVSRVINHYPNVPEKTRKKVMDVIEKYGYEPNPLAQALAGKANREIVLCISEGGTGEKRWKGTESSYFLRLIAELISQAKEFGYMISVFIVSQPSDYSKIENMYLNQMVCGGIFVGFEYEMEALNSLIEQGFCMVVIDPADNMSQGENVSGIYSQNQDAAYMATRYLINKGEKVIAHLSGDMRLSGRDRIAGFQRAMTEAGYDRDKLIIVPGNFDSEMAYAAACNLLQRQVTGIFAASDLMAIAAIRAARDINLRVPEDIKIVGCDYNSEYEFLGYHLTTIVLSIHEVAKMAVSAISGNGKGEKLICEARLRVGATA